MTFELRLPSGFTHTITAATDGEVVVQVIALLNQSVTIQELGKDDQQRTTYACVGGTNTLAILTKTS